MRFNTHEEVKAAAEKWAAELYALHIEKGHSLNPYCTEGARSEFRRAYDNGPFYSFDRQDDHARGFDFRFQVGQAVARIVKSHQQ
jgi:hypothetical protein